MRAEKPREIAVRVLRQHSNGAGWLEEIFDDTAARSSLAPIDRALAQEIAFGVVRWQGTLDWLIARKTGGRPQKSLLQILLRVGLYQLFWLDRVPDHAAVHETVELARQLGFGPQSGFVNAVLRGCLREREAVERELEVLKTQEPHLGWSHPQWLCDRWEKRWGGDKLRALLEWDNTPPAIFIRVNILKTTPEKLAAQFEAEGVLFTPRTFEWAPEGLVFELRSHPPLAGLKSFQEGAFYIQDPSTLLAVRELDPQPGESVLDLCAAPGGKTTFIAQRMEDRGNVIAQDAEPRRLSLVRENCQRLGVTCVSADESVPPEGTTQYDRVLVDAPCSNTGVMRRRVELRWRVRPTEIERLRKVQLELLRKAARQLKPGGTLVYSTCSLEPEENGAVTAEFLAGHGTLQLDAERELNPFKDRVDGAYIARFSQTGG